MLAEDEAVNNVGAVQVVDESAAGAARPRQVLDMICRLEFGGNLCPQLLLFLIVYEQSSSLLVDTSSGLYISSVIAALQDGLPHMRAAV